MLITFEAVWIFLKAAKYFFWNWMISQAPSNPNHSLVLNLMLMKQTGPLSPWLLLERQPRHVGQSSTSTLHQPPLTSHLHIISLPPTSLAVLRMLPAPNPTVQLERGSCECYFSLRIWDCSCQHLNPGASKSFPVLSVLQRCPLVFILW